MTGVRPGRGLRKIGTRIGGRLARGLFCRHARFSSRATLFVILASIQLALRRFARAWPKTQHIAGAQRMISKVGKSNCEGTFAKGSGNDEVVPIADLPALTPEPEGSTPDPCRASSRHAPSAPSS